MRDTVLADVPPTTDRSPRKGCFLTGLIFSEQLGGAQRQGLAVGTGLSKRAGTVPYSMRDTVLLTDDPGMTGSGPKQGGL